MAVVEGIVGDEAKERADDAGAGPTAARGGKIKAPRSRPLRKRL